MAYTDYQQRALYGAGQSASRAGQRFLMEANALRDGDIAAAKYPRRRANDLNRQGAYEAVRGMGGEKGLNQYFATTSSGQPIYSTNFPGQFALSSKGRDVFDKFRDTGFVEPIRQKKRYAPNTEPTGIGSFFEKALGNTLFGRMASNILPKKAPEPDDAYYKSLWGKGLNEMYGPSGIFSAGKFLGKPQIDPYYRRPYKGPKWAERFLKPFVQPRSDAFGVVRDSSIPEDWEFMQEKPLDALSYKYGIADLIPDDIKNEEINAINEIANSGEGIFYGGRGDLSPDFDYEEDREGRELSEKIAFLQSINPNVDYNNVMPELIDQLYEKALRDSDTTSEISTANTQDEMKDLKKQIMSNPGTTTFGDISQLYGIDANVFDPEAFYEEQKEKGIMPNMVTGIDESIEIPE